MFREYPLLGSRPGSDRGMTTTPRVSEGSIPSGYFPITASGYSSRSLYFILGSGGSSITVMPRVVIPDDVGSTPTTLLCPIVGAEHGGIHV